MKQLVEPGQGEVNSQERKKLGEREMEAAAVAKVFLPGPFHLEAAGPFHLIGYWSPLWLELLDSSIAGASLPFLIKLCWVLPSHRLLDPSITEATVPFRGRSCWGSSSPHMSLSIKR